jgi:hypothetical protein
LVSPAGFPAGFPLFGISFQMFIESAAIYEDFYHQKVQGPGALRPFPEPVRNEEQGMPGSILLMVTLNITFVKCRAIAVIARRPEPYQGLYC